jgi:hypothetical protein
VKEKKRERMGQKMIIGEEEEDTNSEETGTAFLETDLE